MVLWMEDTWIPILDLLEIRDVKSLRLTCWGSMDVIKLYKRFAKYQYSVASFVRSENFTHDSKKQKWILNFAIKNQDLAIIKLVAQHYADDLAFVTSWISMVNDSKDAVRQFFSSQDKSYHQMFISWCEFCDYDALLMQFIILLHEGEIDITNKILESIKIYSIKHNSDKTLRKFQHEMVAQFARFVDSGNLSASQIFYPYVTQEKCKHYLMSEIVRSCRVTWLPWLISLKPTREDWKAAVTPFSSKSKISLSDKTTALNFCATLSQLLDDEKDFDVYCELNSLRANLEAPLKDPIFNSDFWNYWIS